MLHWPTGTGLLWSVEAGRCWRPMSIPLEECRQRHAHIQTKTSQLSAPLSSSQLPTVSAFKSSVTTIGNFALDQQCQIGARIAGHHKLLQWKAWVKLTDMSNEFAILKAVINQRKFDGTGVMLLIDWGDSADSPCWLVFEYLPCQDLSRRGLAEDGAIQPWLAAAFFIQLKHGLLFVQQVGYCHADIKPANLMVDFQTQQMKLCNFQSAVPCGAMDLNSEVEGQSHQSYTESYRAPELWRQFAEYTGSRNDLHTSRTDLRLLTPRAKVNDTCWVPYSMHHHSWVVWWQWKWSNGFTFIAIKRPRNDDAYCMGPNTYHWL